MLTFNQIMNSKGWASKAHTEALIGLNSKQQVVTADITKMPHLLVAGTTGSGKSVLMHSIICSLLKRNTYKQVQFVMIDPKIVEFSIYKKCKQVIDVVTETNDIIQMLESLIGEMNRRYTNMSKYFVRSISEYRKVTCNNISTIVVCVDELADLVLENRKAEQLLVRLAQKARAAGIHLICATQRPDSKVLSGLLRSNIPSRIALRVQKSTESKIILDELGAEKLKGKGDMLFNYNGNSKRRLQGVNITDNELYNFICNLE